MISGYLITSIILSEKADGTFTIGRLYERRARRILPPLLLMLAVSIPLAWYLLPPYDMALFTRSMLAVTLFASNVVFWKEAAMLAPLTSRTASSLNSSVYRARGCPSFLLLILALSIA